MQLPKLSTYEDLYDFAKENGLEKTKLLLRQWVLDDQPKWFMTSYFSRTMCRCASEALEGLEPTGGSLMTTKYGLEIYLFMLGINDD